MTEYPSPSDYVRALQDPQRAFRAPELRSAEFAVDPLWGTPRPASGSSAVVFRATVNGRDQALRFFIREDASVKRRYDALGRHVATHGLRDCASAVWVDDAIQVNGYWWPVLQMEWIEGRTLDTYVEHLADRRDVGALRVLAGSWRDLVERLQSAEFAHGDLQHGNVLVDPSGTLRLVDLDEAWIPAFEGWMPPMAHGHLHYQRADRTWGRWMDTFPALVIYTALLAVSHRPDAWQQLHQGENLLFTRDDFARPGATAAWQLMAEIADPQVERAVGRLRACCAPGWSAEQTLTTLLAPRQTAPPITATRPRIEEPRKPALSQPAPHRPPVSRPPSVPADVDTLAALLSPASRVEPELLRAVRLECLPELPVDAEQELWFSPLVDARSDGGMTFAPEEARELRARLRDLYEGYGRALVERAREVLDEVHVGISPLLRLEEELAWHEVVGDAAGAAAAADVAVRAVAARRDGVVHWVERVWSTLPESVRRTPSGWVLGHVAGARTDLPDTPGRLADHHLEALLATAATTRLGIARADGLLRLGVPLDEAEATIDLPDTHPRIIEVVRDVTVLEAADSPVPTPMRVLVGDGEVVEVPVSVDPVPLRTLTGDVFLFGDDRRELLDSVQVAVDGTWCITRVTEDLAVVGHVGSLWTAPTQRAPIDLAAFVGRVGLGDGGVLLAVVRDEASSPPFAARSLPVRELGPLVSGAVVRTLARGSARADVVTLRSTEPIVLGLVGLDAAGADLIVGAPLVDDDERLVGVVAPPSWGDGAAAVSSALLEQVGGRSSLSRQLLHVRSRSVRDVEIDEEIDRLELSGGAVVRAARDATSLWLAELGRDGSGSLLARFDRVEISTGLVRRRVRAMQPERFPANIAIPLLEALDAKAGTTRLLTEDEVRLVEAFVADVRRSADQEPSRAAAGMVMIGGTPAARVGDVTSHPGVVAPPGVPTVLINGRPAATVATATHICSFPPPAVHPPSSFVPGSPTVLIGGLPALRIGDIAGCGAVIIG